MEKDLEKKIEEIKNKKQFPKEQKNNAIKEIFFNLLIAILIIIYFGILKSGIKLLNKDIATALCNCYSLVFLFSSLTLFEIAYKKDSGKLAFNAIEMLGIGLITLCFPYIAFELNIKYNIYINLITLYVAIYYLIKCIFIYIIDKRKYNKKNKSDIKDVIEPVKAEKRESLKTNKPKEKIKEENNKRQIKKENFNKEAPKKVEEEKTNIEAPKKNRGRPKKQDTNIIEETKKEDAIIKKRGRPKKQDINIIEESKKENDVPKKRGRPKKEDTLNKQQVITEPQEKAIKKRGRPKKEVKETETQKISTPKKRGRPRKVS